MALYDALLLPWPPLLARAPGKAPRAPSQSERRHPLPQAPEPPRWPGGLWALLRSRKACAWPGASVGERIELAPACLLGCCVRQMLCGGCGGVVIPGRCHSAGMIRATLVGGASQVRAC